MFTTRSKRRILFETFVVVVVLTVAILSLVKILDNSRESSRNIARVTQIQEYQKAFNIRYSDTGTYPFDENQNPTCLGSYQRDVCWKNNSLKDTGLISSTLVPEYMSRLPEGEKRKFGENGSYKGMVYIPGIKGKSYKILYFMEGRDHPCIIDNAVGTNSGFDTLCILSIP